MHRGIFQIPLLHIKSFPLAIKIQYGQSFGRCIRVDTLRKLAHAIYKELFQIKIENFHQKNFDIFLIFAQNIDCGYMLEPPRRGGSNEYPQSMFWSKNKKNRCTLQTPVLLYKSGV